MNTLVDQLPRAIWIPNYAISRYQGIVIFLLKFNIKIKERQPLTQDGVLPTQVYRFSTVSPQRERILSIQLIKI